MRFDDQLTERQTDAATADFGRLAELEHFRAPLRRHARPGVADVDGQLIAGGIDLHVNFAAVGLSLHGVAQQVVESLAQPGGVALQLPWSGHELFGEIDLLRRARRTHRFQARVQNFGDVDRFAVHGDRRGIVGEIAHQPVDLPNARVEGGDGALRLMIFFVSGADLAAQHFQVNRQRIERRLYFMGEGARGDRQSLHRRRRADVFLLLHDQAIDQIQAGADFVMAGVMGSGRVGSRFGLAQRLADQTKAARVERRGEQRRDQSDAAAENEKQSELTPKSREQVRQVSGIDPKPQTARAAHAFGHLQRHPDIVRGRILPCCLGIDHRLAAAEPVQDAAH